MKCVHVYNVYVICTQQSLNTGYLPEGQETQYLRSGDEGNRLTNLIPQGKTQEEFTNNLATKFRSVSNIYKSNISF